MTWIRRSLAVVHLVAGLFFLAGGISGVVLGVLGFFNLLTRTARAQGPGALLLVAATVVLPGLGLGSGMLVLARWLWSGHPRLRAALLAVHACVLLLGALFIRWGFDAVAAAERSTARGGGLLSPVAFLPFVFGVPLLVFALASIAVALWAVPPSRNPSGLPR
jgi:hypothetical protein